MKYHQSVFFFFLDVYNLNSTVRKPLGILVKESRRCVLKTLGQEEDKGGQLSNIKCNLNDIPSATVSLLSKI